MNSNTNSDNTWTTVRRGWTETPKTNSSFTRTSNMPAAFSKGRGAPTDEESARREAIRQANAEAGGAAEVRERRAKKEREDAERKQYDDFTAFISESTNTNTNKNKSVLDFSGTVRAMKAREEEEALRAATEAASRRRTTNFAPLGLAASGPRMRRRYEDEESDEEDHAADNNSIYSEDSDDDFEGLCDAEDKDTATAPQDNSDSFANTRRRGDKGIW
jgi:hypothetical protein